MVEYNELPKNSRYFLTGFSGSTGEALVSNNALVNDNVLVSDNVRVCDSAWVCDFVRIKDNAIVCNNAEVSNFATVRNNAWVSNNGLICNNLDYLIVNGIGHYNTGITFYKCKDDEDDDDTVYIGVSCDNFNGRLDDFVTELKKCKDDKYVKEHLAAIDMVKIHFDLT